MPYAQSTNITSAGAGAVNVSSVGSNHSLPAEATRLLTAFHERVEVLEETDFSASKESEANCKALENAFSQCEPSAGVIIADADGRRLLFNHLTRVYHRLSQKACDRLLFTTGMSILSEFFSHYSEGLRFKQDRPSFEFMDSVSDFLLNSDHAELSMRWSQWRYHRYYDDASASDDLKKESIRINDLLLIGIIDCIDTEIGLRGKQWFSVDHSCYEAPAPGESMPKGPWLVAINLQRHLHWLSYQSNISNIVKTRLSSLQHTTRSLLKEEPAKDAPKLIDLKCSYRQVLNSYTSSACSTSKHQMIDWSSFKKIQMELDDNFCKAKADSASEVSVQFIHYKTQYQQQILQPLLRQLELFFGESPCAFAIYIGGSWVYDGWGPKSDLDIAFVVEKEEFVIHPYFKVFLNTFRNSIQAMLNDVRCYVDDNQLFQPFGHYIDGAGLISANEFRKNRQRLWQAEEPQDRHALEEGEEHAYFEVLYHSQKPFSQTTGAYLSEGVNDKESRCRFVTRSLGHQSEAIQAILSEPTSRLSQTDTLNIKQDIVTPFVRFCLLQAMRYGVDTHHVSEADDSDVPSALTDDSRSTTRHNAIEHILETLGELGETTPIVATPETATTVSESAASSAVPISSRVAPGKYEVDEAGKLIGSAVTTSTPEIKPSAPLSSTTLAELKACHNLLSHLKHRAHVTPIPLSGVSEQGHYWHYEAKPHKDIPITLSAAELGFLDAYGMMLRALVNHSSEVLTMTDEVPPVDVVDLVVEAFKLPTVDSAAASTAHITRVGTEFAIGPLARFMAFTQPNIEKHIAVYTLISEHQRESYFDILTEQCNLRKEPVTETILTALADVADSRGIRQSERLACQALEATLLALAPLEQTMQESLLKTAAGAAADAGRDAKSLKVTLTWINQVDEEKTVILPSVM